MMMVSCTPQTTKVATSSDTSSTTSDDDSTDSSSDETSDSSDSTNNSEGSIRWISAGNSTTNLVLSSKDTISFYLAGSDVKTLALENENSPLMCLVLNYIDEFRGVRQQLRLRTSIVDIPSSSEVYLRVDASSKSDNQASCQGEASLLSSSRERLDIFDESEAIYSLEDVCPSCTTSIYSSSIDLYTTASGSLVSNITDETNFFNGLTLVINPEGNVTDNTGSCSNVSCQAAGYGCCLDSQCVDDGQIRDNPDSGDLIAALMDVASDAQNFKRWPSVYYVCNVDTGSPIDPDDGEDDEDETDPTDDANQLLQEHINDYRCLNEDVLYCDPDRQSVLEDVWTRCGCMLDPITSDPLDPRCPDYNLKTVEDTSGNIIRVECDIPVDDSNPAPFQNLDIGISARSAPHRFFDSNGVNYDELSSTTQALEQEGEQFTYLNVASKLEPVETSYSMNSILGMFSLDGAQPAYSIDVEIDKLYIIRSVSGYYTPCSSCQKDPWYNAFSSHPETTNTHGLQWRNYTTSRNGYLNNTTKGNYEDTIFGRACWLPPTMLAFSHHENADLNTQRRNRLSTQAAMWINGYQRDWYGFNKGALIGSFDGVKWFAIGNDRRVKSTSKKLFLAINAPFADLAEPTSYNVSVLEDLGGQNASDFDYNIDLDPLHASQNVGASCQYMHQCEVDSDCVSKLGWEYSCADVTDIKSNWPRFDLNADESANNGYSNGLNFENILFNGITGTNKKRCVYRGAGSVCKLDYTSDVTKENRQKLLACAPNYHCRSLNENAFNKEIIRTPNDPNNFLYGYNSNTLGRLKKFFGASETLSTEIKTNIAENIKKFVPSASSLANTLIYQQYGLCVPGRDTGLANIEDSHQSNSPDAVDSISKIGACDPDQTGDARFYSCPTFDSDGNYILSGSSAATLTARKVQNMCSGESQDSTNTSNFSEIEVALNALSLDEESFAASACFRRAGSPCHTNFDCSPNGLHAEIAQTKGLTDFGGTLAESLFWQETLVCSQQTSAPVINVDSSEEYYNYDMGQNRCCMPTKQDFTMYSSIKVAGDATNTNASKIAGYDADNVLLETNVYPYDGPSVDGRYSRYAVSQTGADITIDTSTVLSDSDSIDQWKTINETGEANCCGGGFIRKFDDGTNNWSKNNRLNISPQNFACLNYTNNLYKEAPVGREAQWAVEYNKFCFFPRTIEDSPLGTAKAGCIQSHIEEFSLEGSITAPTIDPELSSPAKTTTNLTNTVIEFRPDDDTTGNGNVSLTNTIGQGVLYYPDSYIQNNLNADESLRTANEYRSSYLNDYYRFIDHNNFVNEENSFGEPVRSSTKIGLILPIYAVVDSDGDDVINDIAGEELSFTVHLRGESLDNVSSAGITDTPTITTIGDTSVTSPTACETLINNNAIDDKTAGGEHLIGPGGGTTIDIDWCVIKDNGRYILLASITSDEADADANGSDWDYGWPEISFTTLDTNPEYKPGNAKYYLDKLGKYELLGIPQVTQDPIYCNDINDANGNGVYDDDEIDTVPGLLKRESKDEVITNTGSTEAIINTSASTGKADSTELHFTEDNMQVQQIFSANEFRCCSKLGDEVADDGKCCSGYANNNIDGKNRCAIPAGTNLMVYLNKYVSSEAFTRDESLRMYTGDDPSTSVVEKQEFDRDGFPLYDDDVYAKVKAIGRKYCENLTVREGGAFGYYVPQPNIGVVGEESDPSGFYSIVDSPADNDLSGTGAGYTSFTNGYRWNHHLYCDDQ